MYATATLTQLRRTLGLALAVAAVACGPGSGDLAVTESRSTTTSCPDQMNYSDGSGLRNGEWFYYPNGTPIFDWVNEKYVMLYPDGSSMKDSQDAFRYADGRLLQGAEDHRAYYPNGALMRELDAWSRPRWFYPSGNSLRDGYVVRYDNMQTAIDDSDVEPRYYSSTGTLQSSQEFYAGHSSEGDPRKFVVPVGALGTIFGPAESRTSFEASFDVTSGLLSHTEAPRVLMYYGELTTKPHVDIRWRVGNQVVWVYTWFGDGAQGCQITNVP